MSHSKTTCCWWYGAIIQQVLTVKMGEEAVEVPNWLNELEAKRERRLKARLGHEAGAGAPCLTCDTKCPGLDLHFWRKICKNCKCSKENHDVHDDDIYGWAQFQLLGSRPNKIKRKIVLPGKKDEVELEWVPTGQNDTIEKYLQTLPPDQLPVKGSQAAQERKQLLQKQIPIHDIDPSLCHELTDAELKSMADYIEHVKASSVGVGHVVQLGGGFHRGTLHIMDPINASVIASRYPKGVPMIETVSLHGESVAAILKANNKAMENLSLDKKLPTFKSNNHVNVTEYSQLPTNFPYKDINYPNNSEILSKSGRNLPHYQQKQAQIDQIPHPNNFCKDINYSCDNDNREVCYNVGENRGYPEIPSNSSKGIHEIVGNRIGGPPGQISLHQANVAPFSRDTSLNLASHNIDYPPASDGRDTQMIMGEKRGILPHYASGKLNIYSDNQKPTKGIGTIKDLAFSTYDPRQLTPADLINDNSTTYNQNNNHFDGDDDDDDVRKSLKSLNPSQFTVPESNLIPNSINIGAIKDIIYNPVIKTANKGDDNVGFDEETPMILAPIPQRHDDDDDGNQPKCHRCKNGLEDDEFGIFVERNQALFHSNCFKCAGCNQNLADMVYFYDEEGDDVYCGRDYAKIRGIPRCGACDELIFVKEYCLAENATFHIKHFCCFECDRALAGQNYVVEDSQPLCLACFETVKASKCSTCLNFIKPDERGASLNGVHFHANDDCFSCDVCKKPLFNAKLLLKDNKLFCSYACFGVRGH